MTNEEIVDDQYPGKQNFDRSQVEYLMGCARRDEDKSFDLGRRQGAAEQRENDAKIARSYRERCQYDRPHSCGALIAEEIEAFRTQRTEQSAGQTGEEGVKE